MLTFSKTKIKYCFVSYNTFLRILFFIFEISNESLMTYEMNKAWNCDFLEVIRMALMIELRENMIRAY